MNAGTRGAALSAMVALWAFVGGCPGGESPCSPGSVICVGAKTFCSDLSKDPEHCGACDHACQPGESCKDGICQKCSIQCASGMLDPVTCVCKGCKSDQMCGEDLALCCAGALNQPAGCCGTVCCELNSICCAGVCQPQGTTGCCPTGTHCPPSYFCCGPIDPMSCCPMGTTCEGGGVCSK